MGGRKRRATKEVDYSRDQEFSDDDVFEDTLNSDPNSTPVPPSRRRANRAVVKQSFTERGYDPTMPSLRDRFPFAPEFEEDGSPKIELIVGRRPIEDKVKGHAPANENTESTSVVEDEASVPSEDESDGSNGSGDRKSKRPHRKKKKKKESPKKGKTPTEHTSHNVEYEYLIKYKGKSYLHLEWKSATELESMNKSAKTLFKRFLKKLAAGIEDDLEDPNFDASYAEPEKIIDEEEQEILVELSDKELVEWEKEKERDEQEYEKEEKEREHELGLPDGENNEVEKEEKQIKVDREKSKEEIDDEDEKGKRIMTRSVINTYFIFDSS